MHTEILRPSREFQDYLGYRFYQNGRMQLNLNDKGKEREFCIYFEIEETIALMFPLTLASEYFLSDRLWRLAEMLLSAERKIYSVNNPLFTQVFIKAKKCKLFS